MEAVSYRGCQVASEQVETPKALKSPWGLVTPDSLCLRDLGETNLRHCPAATLEQAELVPAVTTQVTGTWGAAARHAQHRAPGRM